MSCLCSTTNIIQDTEFIELNITVGGNDVGTTILSVNLESDPDTTLAGTTTFEGTIFHIFSRMKLYLNAIFGLKRAQDNTYLNKPYSFYFVHPCTLAKKQMRRERILKLANGLTVPVGIEEAFLVILANANFYSEVFNMYRLAQSAKHKQTQYFKRLTIPSLPYPVVTSGERTKIISGERILYLWNLAQNCYV